MSVVLRDYQDDGVSKVRQAFTRVNRVLFCLPTGGGKTVVFCHIAESANKKGNSVTVLVHREELVTQCSLSLAENQLMHRIIAPPKVQRETMRDHIEIHGRSYIHPATDIVVASVQTLIRNFSKLPPPDLIIPDEAHHVQPKSTWGKIIAHYPKAKVLGVTATPERLDGKGMDNCFDELVVGPSMSELIERNYLCIPKLYSHGGADTQDMHTQFGDFRKDEAEEKMSGRVVVGDAVDHYMQICRGVPAIAFCVTVKHAQQVAERFSQAGLRAIALDGTTDKAIRKNALRALSCGQLDIVTSCELISEGVDVPLAAAAILLRPTQSLTLNLQQVGRVLRRYPMHLPIMQQPHMRDLIDADGKRHYAFILDHAGNWMRHGIPQAERNWKLTTDKERRKKSPPGTHECPRCKVTHQIGPDNCPFCGFAYVTPDETNLFAGAGGGDNSVTEIAGRLHEITDTPGWTGGLSLIRSPLKELLKKAHAETHFKEIAAARGYKPGWAYFRMKEMQEGVVPA